MSDRVRDEYVIVRSQKQKRQPQVVVSDQEEYCGDEPVSRRIVKTKQPAHQIKYVSADESYRRYQSSGTNDRERVHVRKTRNGEKVLVDDDDNVIKVLRDSTPEFERRQMVWYETPNERSIVREPKKKIEQSRPKIKGIYHGDESTKVVRKVIFDPTTGDKQTVYEKEKPKKQVVIQRDDSDDDEQKQYVRVVQRRADLSPRREAKYVVYKDHDEPQYTMSSSCSSGHRKNSQIIYEAPKKTSYMYSASRKYYK
ncbi:unnamed protein product [Didymodactylos carnosus]|uniref:Uncharacterized protein n=1 Tax=Didymodactylos carnosus TaxID=1234261 RepID=A0A813RER3_9BILA|nr:unnamed protein product [Didymodactylos carnosus]CAF0830606.1 unnamed protein product [Didymodactylos carnosus]CAF3564389.1 unnamed protein product [Didymodactylos carnosus]CAF3615086.1 unnamed protein product [Didymodactylos carnosus]